MFTYNTKFFYTKDSTLPDQNFFETVPRYPQNSVSVCLWLPDRSAPDMPHNAPIVADSRPSTASTAHSLGQDVSMHKGNERKMPRKMERKGGIFDENSTATSTESSV
jgi:hypothetical protein